MHSLAKARLGTSRLVVLAALLAVAGLTSSVARCEEVPQQQQQQPQQHPHREEKSERAKELAPRSDDVVVLPEYVPSSADGQKTQGFVTAALDESRTLVDETVEAVEEEEEEEKDDGDSEVEEVSRQAKPEDEGENFERHWGVDGALAQNRDFHGEVTGHLGDVKEANLAGDIDIDHREVTHVDRHLSVADPSERDPWSSRASRSLAAQDSSTTSTTSSLSSTTTSSTTSTTSASFIDSSISTTSTTSTTTTIASSTSSTTTTSTEDDGTDSDLDDGDESDAAPDDNATTTTTTSTTSTATTTTSSTTTATFTTSTTSTTSTSTTSTSTSTTTTSTTTFWSEYILEDDVDILQTFSVKVLGSSMQYFSPMSALMDGLQDEDHWWQAEEDDYPGVLSLDLGQPAMLSAFTFTAAEPAFKSLNIYRSDDARNWDMVASVDTSQNCIVGNVFDVPGWSQPTRYVKIQLQDRCEGVHNSGRFTLAELGLWGQPLERMVLQYERSWPHCADFGSCFSFTSLDMAKATCLAAEECDGFSFSAENIKSGRGAGCYKQNCTGTLRQKMGRGPYGYWVKQRNSSISETMIDTYRGVEVCGPR